MDLHPFVDSSGSAIEFRIVRGHRLVRVEVSRATLNQRFGVSEDSQYGLLQAYEAHRDQIDAAVICRAADGGTGVVKVRPTDLG